MRLTKIACRQLSNYICFHQEFLIANSSYKIMNSCFHSDLAKAIVNLRLHIVILFSENTLSSCVYKISL